MKPTSETAWWIVTYTIALIAPSDDPPREPPLRVLRKQVMVRCEHWREAFVKARRIGIFEEQAETTLDPEGRDVVRRKHWQYLGINGLFPLPQENQQGVAFATLDLTSQARTLEDLVGECLEDYRLEESFDEKRAGETYRALPQSAEAGF